MTLLDMIWTAIAALLLSCFVSAAPQDFANKPDPTLTYSPPFDACATVGSMVREAEAASPTVLTDYVYISAQNAIDCLLTVPCNHTAAIEWLESLKPYLGWQSTTAYLKNPPSGYWFPEYDIFARLQGMIDNIQQYKNEYHFELELFKTFGYANDGHLRYFPKLVTGLFGFGRPLSLVSISADGKSKPRPYVYDDIVLWTNDSSRSISPVVQIDGVDAEAKLLALADWSICADFDAGYNSLFANLAQASLGYMGNGGGIFAGGGRGQVPYPGARTNLTFENGTVVSWENFARVYQSFRNIKTGQDVYDRFLNVSSTIPLPGGGIGQADTDDRPGHIGPPLPNPQDPILGPPGYPTPVRFVAGGYMGGYYLDGQGYEDAAVLSLPGFGTQLLQTAMQATVTEFIKQAKVYGKMRLIIDLSANGGGQIPLAYSIFKTLFPDIDPYGASRFRATEDFDLLGQAVSQVVGDDYPWDPNYPPGPSLLLNNYRATPFITQADMTANGHTFLTWADKFGPHEFHGDNFTTLMRWNFSDPGTNEESGFIPNGYGNRTNVTTERPFFAGDIIILTDGWCASTCSIFVELMTSQAKVKTVAVGGISGRPADAVGPMQAVGGVRGANVYQFSTLAQFAQGAPLLSEGNATQQAILNSTLAQRYSQLPMLKAADGDGRVNVRDQIRIGDETQTPLQFVYQKADCRIFYELAHTVSMMAMWKTVYDVTWNGASCREGSAYSAPQHNITRGGRGKRDPMRAVVVEDIEKLRHVWKIGTDVTKIEPMSGFQVP